MATSARSSAVANRRFVGRMLDSLLDNYADFDFKKKFNASSLTKPVDIAKWVDPEDMRRLTAYNLLEAYCRNKARTWAEHMVEEGSQDPSNRREYGEPLLLVETTLSSLLGSSWEIFTEGAVGEEVGEEAEPVKQQRLLEKWAVKEKFDLKVIESETQSIKLGDSVYVLGWDDQTKRPRLHVYDPGFYFPEFDIREAASEDFPKVVVVAWEFMMEDGSGKEKPYVRRIRWELTNEDENGNTWNYPVQYSSERATQNVSYSDEIWELSEAVDEFRGRPYEVLQDLVWLNIDFMPVVHVPNTVNLQGHFGRSSLANALQIIDDIQAVDTDLQGAAATTGTPPIAISGQIGSNEQVSYGPGTVLKTGDGTATVIDTSRSLDALLKLKDSLLERLSVNTRTPESMLGRVKPNEVPSGIALTLSFTPHAGMIKEMRLVRKDKYALLLKFVIRLYKQNTDELAKGGEEIDSNLNFGSFLPADKQETMTIIVQLLAAKAISLETAVKMLVESGYPIEDWLVEIKRIQSTDFEGAQQLMVITGNPDVAADYLGIDRSLVEVDEEEDPTPDE